MEEENRIYNETDETGGAGEDAQNADATDEASADVSDRAADEAFAAQIEKRRRARDKRRVAKKRRTIILLILVLGFLMTMCGKELVRLKAENIALKKQQKELEAERDKLSEELKNSKDRDYVEEKAREQLRLLNEGEILFIFDDEKSSKGSSKGTDDKDE